MKYAVLPFFAIILVVALLIAIPLLLGRAIYEEITNKVY